MPRFEVWAPGRRRVDVVVDGARVAMQGSGGGWWEAGVEAAGPGSRYGFSLDGGPVRPDPRSPSQPDGVFGLSELVDHRAFEWTDHGWPGAAVAGLVIYELHAGTFSAAGTFDGVAQHLDHLTALGVNAVEIMPVAEFSGSRGWGYDGVDLFAPHHAYGGPDGLKRLVDRCHAAGLAVILDVVYNHLGPAGNFLAEFGPYFTDRHHTRWGAAMNFNGAGSEQVRRFVIDNATMWIRDYHFDGLRLDAVDSIVDPSRPHILEEIGVAVREAGQPAGRSTFVIAESGPDDPTLIRERTAGGYGLDAVWADDWHHALHTVLTGEHEGYYAAFGSLDQLAVALRQAWVRCDPPADLPPERFLVATQNHDQVGNRATGTRLSALVDEKRLEIAAALLLSSPFTPLIFQGEEWAASTPFLYFTDHADPELGRAVSQGRRREFVAFGWDPERVPDPQDPATFERSKLHWDELDQPRHRKLLDRYRELISLRRRLAATTRDRVRSSSDATRGGLAFARPGLELRANVREGTLTIDETPLA